MQTTKYISRRAALAGLAVALFLAGYAGHTASPNNEKDFLGAWRGEFHPITRKQAGQTVEVAYEVAPDLRVTGHVGGAQLANARLSQHAWAYRKLCGHKTEYNIQGELVGSVLDRNDEGWNRVYIHLRHADATSTAIVCSPIVSRNWGKQDMMHMTTSAFGPVPKPDAR